MGKVSVRWQAVQQQYFEWRKRRNTGKAWVRALIQKVLEITWDMWDHRNDVRWKRKIEYLNGSITEEFKFGMDAKIIIG
jgi:hypothetical protein